MTYKYEEERPAIFSHDGIKMLLTIYDRINGSLRSTGACTIGHAISSVRSGNSFTMLACIDYLVEIGKVKKVEIPYRMTQDYILVSVE